MLEARRDGARTRLIARMRRDERGATAVMFAASLLLLIPLIVGVFELYYGNEQRGKLQDALDAAALFAARSSSTDEAALTTLGAAALKANFTEEPGASLKSATFKVNGNVVIAEAKLQPASLLASGSTLWRYPDMTVRTEVNRAMDRLEIALVLDNTGSMQGQKLTTLQSSAKSLVDKLKAASDGSTLSNPIKISLVPFSNTVRVQDSTSLATYDPTKTSNTGIPAWIDPKGQSRYFEATNYDNFAQSGVDRLALMANMKRGSDQLKWEGCVEARSAPYDILEDAATTSVSASMYVPWFWPDEADLSSAFKPTGSSSFHAGSYNDYINDVPAWASGRTYGVNDLVSYTPPTPSTYASGTTYSHGALVRYSSVVYQAKNISNNKGRTPSSTSSYWAVVTNFWKATAANTNVAPTTVASWAIDEARDTLTRQKNTAKYGVAANSVSLKNTGWYSLDGTAYGANGSYIYGPNGGCALQPVIRLTTNMQSVKDAIGKMTAIGETNIPLGLAWGWNTLSPVGPFKSDTANYGAEQNRKIIILMTDGENTMNDPTKSGEPNGSFYGGYGYIWQKLLGITSGNSSTRTSKIDGRLALLCENVKKKGIVIYTVRVEVKTGSSSLLQNCASRPDMFYDVQNVSQLSTAFDAIARSIDNLRISK